MAHVVEGSQYKWIHEGVYQKEKNPAKAAGLFLDFVKEFPRSRNADRALTSALVIFQEAGQIDRGIAAGERVITEYPGSPFEPKVRFTLARLYEKTADFRKAAGMYSAFVTAQDDAMRELNGGKDRPARGAKKASKPSKKSAPVAEAATPSEELEERRALLAESDKWVADALFNAGLWWEGVGEGDKALAAYRAYLARFKDRPDVPQIAFNVGLVQEKDGKWAEAVRTFETFSANYGRDARTAPGQVYLARYRQLLDYHKLKDAPNVERLQKYLVYAWTQLGAEEKQKPELIDAYGHARFLSVEPDWQRYVGIRFKRVATVRQDLAAKQQAIQKLEKAYVEVLSSGSGEWGVAALTRVGLAYADFARNILESPDPAGLDEEQVAMYRGELENLALPLEDKANEALEKALGKAYELSLYNEWTLAAQEQVNRYHPGQYAQVRQVPFRGSEYFATADVAKEPVTPTPAAEGPRADATDDSEAPSQELSEVMLKVLAPVPEPVPAPATAGEVQP